MSIYLFAYAINEYKCVFRFKSKEKSILSQFIHVNVIIVKLNDSKISGHVRNSDVILEDLFCGLLV